MLLKKSYIKTIITYLAVIILLSGCLTKELWEDSYGKSYEETIDALLINPKDDSLIFVGEKYHYIMQADEKFSYLYNHLNEGIEFNIKQGNFLLQDDNIKATFDVYIKNNNEQTKQWLKKYNYLHQSDLYKNNKYIGKIDYTTVKLQGKRYKADEKVNQVAKKLSKSYTIKVRTKKSNLPDAVKIALTPLSVAGDTIVVASTAVVALPVYIAIGAIMYSNKK